MKHHAPVPPEPSSVSFTTMAGRPEFVVIDGIVPDLLSGLVIFWAGQHTGLP